MHLTEANMISCRSEYFLYSATPKMRNCMYYPHRIGLGAFTPGYRLSRAPMNNFLIAYISEGSFHIRFADVAAVAHEGQFLIVDCYEPHHFSTDEPAEISGSTMTACGEKHVRIHRGTLR